MNEDKLITVKEVAEYLSISPKTVYQWAEFRQLTAYKLKGCLRFKVQDVLQFVESRRVAPSEN